jgi:hypothetical protein
MSLEVEPCLVPVMVVISVAQSVGTKVKTPEELL